MEDVKSLRLADHVKVKYEKCGTVIFEAVNERIYLANETATKVVSMLREGKDLEEIISSLSEEYEVDRGVVERDVYKFVEELEGKGIIKRKG